MQHPPHFCLFDFDEVLLFDSAPIRTRTQTSTNAVQMRTVCVTTAAAALSTTSVKDISDAAVQTMPSSCLIVHSIVVIVGLVCFPG